MVFLYRDERARGLEVLLLLLLAVISFGIVCVIVLETHMLCGLETLEVVVAHFYRTFKCGEDNC